MTLLRCWWQQRQVPQGLRLVGTIYSTTSYTSNLLRVHNNNNGHPINLSTVNIQYIIILLLRHGHTKITMNGDKIFENYLRTPTQIIYKSTYNITNINLLSSPSHDDGLSVSTSSMLLALMTNGLNTFYHTNGQTGYNWWVLTHSPFTHTSHHNTTYTITCLILHHTSLH